MQYIDADGLDYGGCPDGADCGSDFGYDGGDQSPTTGQPPNAGTQDQIPLALTAAYSGGPPSTVTWGGGGSSVTLNESGAAWENGMAVYQYDPSTGQKIDLIETVHLPTGFDNSVTAVGMQPGVYLDFLYQQYVSEKNAADEASARALDQIYVTPEAAQFPAPISPPPAVGAIAGTCSHAAKAIQTFESANPNTAPPITLSDAAGLCAWIQ